MIAFIKNYNLCIFILFSLCYMYQLFYVFVRFSKKYELKPAKKLHKYAVLISARNESAVIGHLLKSIRAQNYPTDLLDIIVVADNCTDNTAEIAREYGAIVFERFNRQKVGKGYALDYAFQKIQSLYGVRYYEGYLVFDADNVLDSNYVQEINKVFDAGYRVVTSYRNSKNYGSNWLSAGYALWFLRESKYLNGPRMICKTSCAISGTGFLVSSAIIEKDRGWKYHLLTEDIEFSIDKVAEGELIGYCETAVLYDEQPVNFNVSWTQRMRWTKGFYQVFKNYGKTLAKGCFKNSGFQCFDMMMTIAPATLLTLLILTMNFAMCIFGLATENFAIIRVSILQVFSAIGNIYISLFFFGLITTITEWKNIHCSAVKKIKYLFTFPVFIFTYVPIAIVALFKKVTWKPIQHTVVKNLQQIRQ